MKQSYKVSHVYFNSVILKTTDECGITSYYTWRDGQYFNNIVITYGKDQLTATRHVFTIFYLQAPNINIIVQYCT